MIRVCVNGPEWLCRRPDEKGIRYPRYDNALVDTGDVEAAQELCQRFVHRNWPRLCNALARRFSAPMREIAGRRGKTGVQQRRSAWITRLIGLG